MAFEIKFETKFQTRRLLFSKLSFKAYVSQIWKLSKISLNVFAPNTTFLKNLFYKSLN
jgi:hypothetical protein